MGEVWTVLVAASALGGVLALAASRALERRSGAQRLLDRLDAMQDALGGWQTAYAARVRGIERRMTDIEVAVASAEESARVASLEMARIRGPLLGRLEAIEQRREIQVLVAQGRIPPEHLDGWGEP